MPPARRKKGKAPARRASQAPDLDEVESPSAENPELEGEPVEEERAAGEPGPLARTGRVDDDGSLTPMSELAEELDDPGFYYPSNATQRGAFLSPSGKRLTAHQWAVYDFARKIPKGRVSTYKVVCDSVGGSPRSVGSALRHNPFAPHVPCHRVIASSLFLGGFCGEWGKDSKTGLEYDRKLQLLEEEGVLFDKRGYMKDPKLVWPERLTFTL